MGDLLKNIVFTLYIIVAIAITVLLLSYNEYMCSEINGYTFYIAKDDILEPDYKKGDLLIIKQSSDLKINENDRVVLYRNISPTEYTLRIGNVTGKTKLGSQTVYQIDQYSQYDSSYLIGKESDITVIPYLGTILSILESRWGYLFSIVIVTLLLLLQELYDLFLEVKYGTERQEVKGSK